MDHLWSTTPRFDIITPIENEHMYMKEKTLIVDKISRWGTHQATNSWSLTISFRIIHDEFQNSAIRSSDLIRKY